MAFGTPLPSYEGTVLFMIANFQYLVTCMSFSIAKPFRKQIWTNWPFLGCVIFLSLFQACIIFLPSDSKVYSYFDLEPFKADGKDYYSYRYWIASAIVVNAILTYTAEKLIIEFLTRKADQRQKEKKEKAFHQLMCEYKAQKTARATGFA